MSMTTESKCPFCGASLMPFNQCDYLGFSKEVIHDVQMVDYEDRLSILQTQLEAEKDKWLEVAALREELEALKPLIDEVRFHLRVDTDFPMAEALAAYDKLKEGKEAQNANDRIDSPQ